MFTFKYDNKYLLHYVIATIYLTSVLSTIYMVSGAATTFNKPYTDEWKLNFFTGDKAWAGTDSMVYIQVHGQVMDSQIFQLNPEKYQMEAHAVDTYIIQLPKNIGNIKSITVGKQHSYSFFNDWQLIKAELVDPQGRKFIFNCNCWLTTLRYKRTIELTSVDGIDILSGTASDPFSMSSGRTTRVFPMTIGLLFLLLILIIFTYFGNVMCKKWKQNIFINGSSRQSRQRAVNGSSRPSSHRVVLSTSNSRNGHANRQNNLYKDDDDDEESLDTSARDGVYNFTNNLTDLNVNNTNRQYPETIARNSHGLNDDKPPEYTQLFPIKSINKNEDNLIEENNETEVSSNKKTIAGSKNITSL